MTAESWRKAREVFEDAQAVAPDGRDSYVRRLVGDDSELMAAVMTLLHADAAAGDFLKQPYISTATELFRPGRSLIGEHVGHYRLASLVAETGASSLYRAHRVDALLRRDVAVKVHWAGASNHRPSQRLLAEVSALARLDHHGVCRLYDVTTLTTEAYCEILEWIDGQNIKAWCDRLRLPVKERVQRLLPVLEALQHVHSTGVLHGDIKEEHVLVTAQAHTKIIDFGASRGLTNEAAVTPPVVDFTPEYASPELLRGEELDVRADLYSFGILMYRVLVGMHPYAIRSGLLTDIADVVLNDEPSHPVKLLSTSTDGDGAGAPIAAQRSTSIQRLLETFSTDLSLIMLRAIHKPRAERYDSASELTHDLRAWLEGRPTIAAARRHRVISDEPKLSWPLKVFLCHCSEDKPTVRELGRRLRSIGATTWLDEDDLLPGQEWEEEIPKAVAGADVVIVCLSEHSLTKRGFVQKEIKFALDVADEQPQGRLFIIPVRMADCDVPERLKRWQWVNMFEEQGFSRLVKALRFQAQRAENSVQRE